LVTQHWSEQRIAKEVVMLSLSRHRFAPRDLRANRVEVPDLGPRRLAMRASRILVGALITTGLISGSLPIHPALAASQPPIGYERWTVPNANSGVDYGQTTKQVFEKYAAQMVIAMPVPDGQVKDKRLIDIEVRGDDSPLANYVYDVVWVKNEGHFELESWFVPGMTEAELHLLPQLAPQGIVAADVERYPEGNQWRYSVILQRNAGEFGWEVLTNASLEQVLDTANRRGMRVLDLDYATPGPLNCPTVPGQACALATLDAILVADSGSNAVDTSVHFNMSPALIDQKEAQGWQAIDREDGGESVVTVWVKAGQPFEILDDLSDNEVTFEHGHHGRVVDLEGEPNAFSIVRFDGSPAPALPGLADPRQGDNGDGRRDLKTATAKPRARPSATASRRTTRPVAQFPGANRSARRRLPDESRGRRRCLLLLR
jgi:hypothetical protein